MGIDYHIPDVLGGAQYGCYTSEDNTLVADKDIITPTYVKLISPSSKMTYSLTLDS